MSTLTNKQSSFLTDYSMMVIVDEVNEKLDAFLETDEWKNAVEEGKKDEKVLEKVEKERTRLNNLVKANELKKQVKELAEELEIPYVLGFTNSWDNTISLANPFMPTDVEGSVEKELECESERYARNKTGHINKVYQWSTPMEKVHTEVRSRMSVEPQGNFDEITDNIISLFDTEELFQKVLEHNKRDNDNCCGLICEKC